MPTLKQTALYTLAGTVILGVALSIMAVLGGTWDWFEARVVLTSFTISGASISALICAALRERDEASLLPVPGLVLSSAGATLVIFAMWADVGDLTYGRLTVSVVLFAMATAHVSGLSMARLSPGSRWAIVVAWASIFGLASMLTAMTWTNDWGAQAFQLVAVLAIVTAGITVLIPILHWLGGPDVAVARSVAPFTSVPVTVICPCCGFVAAHSLGTITCRQCQGVFAVTIIRAGRAYPA
jgi:hypothetical protein